MNGDWERDDLVDLQSGLRNDIHQTSFLSFQRPNTHYSALDDPPLSPPRAEAYSQRTPLNPRLNFNGDWEIEEGLDESLEGLDLNNSESFPVGNLFDRTLSGRGAGGDANRPRNISETNYRMLTPEFAESPIGEAQNLLTSSQIFNAEESFSPWRSPGRWSEESSVNLRPPAYTPHRSSATTNSPYSDSAWETEPSTPTDEFDVRPVPDEFSASTQSYNDPQTGVWENIYGRDSDFSTTRDRRHGNVLESIAPQLLPQNLQPLFINADTATPFGTRYHTHEEAMLGNTGLGAHGRPSMIVPPSSPRPTRAQPSHPSRSELSIEINGTVNSGASSMQQPPVAEHFFPPRSDQDRFPNTALRVTSNNSHLQAINLPPAVSMRPPASPPSPSSPATTSDTGAVRCTYRGCRAKFTGGYWKDSLRRHMSHHGDKPKPTCLKCHMVFQSGRTDNLKRHIQAQHPESLLPASLNTRTKKSAPKRRRS